jgi:ketosteroid isomerase-like protein
VLSEDALRRIGDLDREQIEQRIRLLFEKWARGDIEGMVGYLAPDVVFPSNGFWTGVPAPLRSREQVAKTLRRLGGALENIVSVLHEIVIDGDRVVVHRTAVGRRRDNGRRYQCDFIDFFRFRDGLVVEFSEYPDAAWRDVEPAI